jgi:hypothetical protein
MTSDLPITTRNLHAKLVLTSGAKVVLREVLFGEQVQIGAGRFAADVTPMSHGRFRLIQMKEGVKAPIDIPAQHVDRIARRGATAALGPMPRPSPEDRDLFDLTVSGLPYSGKVQMFNGRGAIHGTDDKTGAERVVLLQDVQLMEVSRRKAMTRPPSADEVAAYYDRPDEPAPELTEVSVPDNAATASSEEPA